MARRTAAHQVRTRRARLNIYLPDATLRRQVKTAAARRDLAVSEYCVQAITAQLVRDAELPPTEDLRLMQKTAVAEARRFRAEAFASRVFRVTSADLIREARGERPPDPEVLTAAWYTVPWAQIGSARRRRYHVAFISAAGLPEGRLPAGVIRLAPDNADFQV